VSQYQLAKAVDVSARRINEIVHGQRRISADAALRLALFRNLGAQVISFSRITADPAVMDGQPSVCGIRRPVATVVAMVTDG
jgi:transcriptional regulator with XRE-family HTH domain